MSHRAIALLLAGFTVILLSISVQNIGLTWDEPVYIEASEIYVEWLGEAVRNPSYAFGREGIQEYWEFNHEHPPFDKLWSGLVWSGARYFFDNLTAHRLGNIFISAGLVALLYLFVAQRFGHIAGLAAVGALLTMPRFFFHAHLAALDVPTTATMFLVVYLFWITLERPGIKWGVVLGVVYGLALGTKINAFIMLPIVLGIWSFFFRAQRYIFVRLALMGVTGLIVFFVLWPWLYYDTWNRLIAYLDFMTINHYPIEQYYLGRWWSTTPRHFPFAMTLMVVPLTLTILTIAASLYVVKEGRGEALGWLFGLGALIPMVVLATGKTEVFDNERLLMPVFPHVAALAGIGFAQVLKDFRQVLKGWGRARWASPLMVTIAVVAFGPQVVSSYSLYPHLLSYYSETVGGLPGAKRLGMETTYWCETYAAAIPYINAHAPFGALIWVEGHDPMLYYQAKGQLRRDLRIGSTPGLKTIVRGMNVVQASIEEADIAVIQHREAGFADYVTEWIGHRDPVYEISYLDIPLMSVYTR